MCKVTVWKRPFYKTVVYILSQLAQITKLNFKNFEYNGPMAHLDKFRKTCSSLVPLYFNTSVKCTRYIKNVWTVESVTNGSFFTGTNQIRKVSKGLWYCERHYGYCKWVTLVKRYTKTIYGVIATLTTAMGMYLFTRELILAVLNKKRVKNNF